MLQNKKTQKAQPATATQTASTTQTVITTQTVTATQVASATQTIATDECDGTITTNKHGNLTLNGVCTNVNGDKVSLGKKSRDSGIFANLNKLLDPKIVLNPHLLIKPMSGQKNLCWRLVSF